jgi:hypothetical protein
LEADSCPEEYVRLNDLFDPERGPSILVQFALYPLVFAVISQLIIVPLCRLPAIDIFVVFIFLILMSPLAYLIRKARGHRPERGSGRRGGAERTPLLPPNEDVG